MSGFSPNYPAVRRINHRFEGEAEVVLIRTWRDRRYEIHIMPEWGETREDVIPTEVATEK